MGLIAIEEVEDGVHWTADGRSSHTATSLEAVMDGLAEAHVVICEPSFYYGLRDVRRILGEILARRGHRLVPISRSAQAALELAACDDDLGSGVCGLFSIVTAGSGRLDRLRGSAENHWDVQAALDVVHAIDTFEGQRISETSGRIGGRGLVGGTVGDGLGSRISQVGPDFVSNVRTLRGGEVKRSLERRKVPVEGAVAVVHARIDGLRHRTAPRA